MAVNSIYRVSVEYNYNDQVRMNNVVHYKAVTATIFDTQAEDLCQAVAADFVSSTLKGVLPSIAEITKVTVYGVTDPLEAAELDLVGQVGTNGGDTLPYQSAAIITWRTGVPGRQNRGRSYLPPFVESAQVRTELVQAYIDDLDQWADEIKEIGDAVATAEYALVVYSTVAESARLVTAHKVQPLLGVQRRRRPGVGI